MPLDAFVEEVRFFDLGDVAFDKFREAEGYTKDEEQPLPEAEWQKQIWLLMEHPESSVFAKYAAIMSVVIILASIVIFCLETLPRFKRFKLIHTFDNKTRIIEEEVPSPAEPFFIIETTCIIWFSVEFILRFLSCPSKIAFIKVGSCFSFSLVLCP